MLAGIDGLDNRTDDSQEPEAVPAFKGLNKAVIDFKSLARFYLGRKMRHIEFDKINGFIEFLDRNENIEFDEVDFIEELESMEQQFFQLRKKMSFVPFVESFIRRLDRYKEKVAGPSEIFDFVYAAALTKLRLLKDPSRYISIVNLVKYIETNEQHIAELHDTQKLMAIHDHFENFQRKIQGRIEFANTLLKDEIIPEIDCIFEGANQNVNVLIDEIVRSQQNAAQNIIAAEIQKNALERSIALANMMSVVKFASAGLMLAGPYGFIAGSAIQTITGSYDAIVAQTNEPFSTALKKPMTRLNDAIKYKSELMKLRMKEFEYRMEEYTREFQSPESSELQRRISEKIHEIREHRKNANTPDIDEHIRTRDELDKLVQRHKKTLEIKTDTDTSMRTRALQKINKAAAILDIPMDIIKTYSNNRAKMDVACAVIETRKGQLEQLKVHEQNIYEILLPKMRLFEGQFKSSLNMSGDSHTALDIKRWKMQNWLRGIGREFEKMTDCFKAGDELKKTMQKLNYAIKILVDIYDRIESMADSEELARYMSNLASSSHSYFNESDSTLPWAKLRQIIQTNLMLREYEIVIHAFQQHKFPFAQTYMMDFTLSESDEIKSNMLARRIIQKLGDLKEKLEENSVSITKYDHDVRSNIQFGSGLTPAFYKWDYYEIKNEITRLFAGESITIEANIIKGIKQNAVKAKRIHLRLKARNETINRHLQNVLRSFWNSMTLTGDNFYRCDGRIYGMEIDESIVIAQSFASYNEEPIGSNEDYHKLADRNSDIFLSPYGSWQIKLTDGDFSQLKPFENETIDMEMVGTGQYFNSESQYASEICNHHLNEFYNFYNDITNEESEIEFHSFANGFLLL